MRKTSFLIPGLLALLSVCSARAQSVDSRVERSRISSDQSPSGLLSQPASSSLGTGESAPSSPGDEDLGEQFIFKRREKVTPFNFFADVSCNYTSNVALQRHGGVSDNFLMAEMGLTWSKAVSQTLALNAGVRQQLFRYDRFSAFDFNGLDATAGASYVLPGLGGVVLNAGYTFDRLTDRHQNEFYTNHTLSVGLQKTWVLSRAHSIFVAYDSDFSVACDPASQRHHYHSFSAGYNVDLTRHFSAMVGYKFTLIDYTSLDRLDANNLLSLGINYKITPWCAVGASGSYVFNNSSRPVFDYEVGNASANLRFSLRF